jgi:antitoxin YqcF
MATSGRVTAMSSNENWGELFYDHFQRYLGNPMARKIYRQDGATPKIQILEFDNVFPGCKVFASFGASNYSETLGVRAEVVLPCDEGWSSVGGLLANVLFYLVQDRIELGIGVGIKFGSIAPDFVERFGKTAIYFTNPFGLPPEFSAVKNDVETACVYLAILISEAEFDYFCNRGAAEFESVLERSGIDPYQVNRASCI